MFALVVSALLPGKALATGIDFQVKNVTVREAVLKLQQQRKVLHLPDGMMSLEQR